MFKKCFLILAMVLLLYSHCLADEESGVLKYDVTEDTSVEDRFESYAELMTCLGVEIEEEEIPLYHYYQSKDWWDDASEEEYLTMIQKSLKAKPNSGRLLMYLGDYYHYLKKNKEEWVRCYQKAYQLQPSDIEIASDYLTVCNELNDEETAIIVFRGIKERLAPILHSSEESILINKAASLYAGALSEMVVLFSRCHDFSLADAYLDELFSIPTTVFSRYACGFEALGYYFDLSEQISDQERVKFCAEMILTLYNEAELAYPEPSNDLFLLNFIYGHVLSRAEEYINTH